MSEDLESQFSIVALQSVSRSLAVDLNARNLLDDQTLERVENRALEHIKGAVFNEPTVPYAEQTRLINHAIEMVRAQMKYIKENRDNGNLKL